MSKKLLMNKYSVNGLLPVQEGLVCWLDAFDLTSYSLGIEWPDRTGNGNGIVREASNVVSVNNGILHACSIVDIPNPTKGLTSYSVEVGYEDLKTGYWLGLWGNTSANTERYCHGLSFHQLGNSYGAFPFYLTTPTKTEINGGKNYTVLTINSNILEIYHNGVKYYTFNSEPKNILPSEANYSCFMARKPNTLTPDATSGTDSRLAKWYYIRIYNKVLTEEEILNNYNYELTLQRG